jgi:hypothetical protein
LPRPVSGLELDYPDPGKFSCVSLLHLFFFSFAVEKPEVMRTLAPAVGCTDFVKEHSPLLLMIQRSGLFHLTSLSCRIDYLARYVAKSQSPLRIGAILEPDEVAPYKAGEGM